MEKNTEIVIISVALIIPILIIGVLAASNLNFNTLNPEGKIEVTDMLGRQVEVPGNIERIVGIEAGALRLLCYLKVTDLVVGVEEFEKTDINKPYALANPQLAELPNIGPIHGGDPELITAVQPDVIFWTYTTVGDADDLQTQTGIPVVAIDYGLFPATTNTLYKALRLIASVVDAEERAEEVITFMNTTINDLSNRTTNNPSQEPVYVGGVSYRGAHGITSTETKYAPFEFLNANNVAGSISQEHIFIDQEQLIEWNPDKIFIDTAGYSLVMDEIANQSALFNTLDAVKNGELYFVMPYNYYTTNIGTVLANAYYIGSILYPDNFSDIDSVTQADHIYESMLGKPVYTEMAQLFIGFSQISS